MSKTRTVTLAGVLALSLVAAACGSDEKDDGAAATTAPAAETTTTAGAADTTAPAETTTTAMAMELKGVLNASGATFPQAFYEESIAAFTEVYPDVTINYGGGGSGKGRQDLADQIVDWAGTDGTIADADLPKFKGGDVLYFPTVVAPIVVAYNLKDVKELQLSADTIAKIFQRNITKWNDAAIAADNPGMTLPDTAITVARRSDSSARRGNFTKFLDLAAGAEASGVWTLKSGSTIEWPADTQGGNGNSGVSQIVTSTTGAIGYVDLSDAIASGLQSAAVKNKAGKFVAPTLEAASAAAEGATIKDNLTFSAVWAEGDASYPITAQTWIIMYKKQTDKAKAEITKEFLRWILTDGQAMAKDVDYAPLPKGLDEKAIAQLDMIEMPA